MLILPGLLFFAVGASLWTDEPEKDDPLTEEDESDDPQGTACMTFVFCVPMFWLPALVLLILAYVGYRDNSGIGEMADLMQAHDTLQIKEVARTMGISQATAKKRMSKCINRGKVEGRMKNDTYFSPRYLDMAQKNLERREYLIDIADILKAYRRVRLEDFGERIGMEPWDAEKVILECLEDGLVHGYISHRSKTFFTKEYLDQLDDVQFGWACRGCGARNTELLLPGEEDKCSYCGSMSKAKGTEAKYFEFELVY